MPKLAEACVESGSGQNGQDETACDGGLSLFDFLNEDGINT